MANTTTKREKKAPSNMKVGFNSKKQVVDMQFDVSKFVKKEELPLSSKEKSYLVASSHGRQEFESADLQGLWYSVNIYVKKEDYDAELEFKRNQEQAKQVVAEQEAVVAGKDAKMETLRKLVDANPAMISTLPVEQQAALVQYLMSK